MSCCSNPNAAKAVLSLCLVSSLDLVPVVLVVADMQGRIWSDQMSSYKAIVNIVRCLLAFFAAGPLGRFGDRCGNRLAVALVGLLVALPTFALLMFGTDSAGLNAWAAAYSLAGLTGSAGGGSPANLALVNEMCRPEDVETMVGISFASVTVFWFAADMIGILIEKTISQTAVLVFIAGFSLVNFALLFSIRKPRFLAAPVVRPDTEQELAGEPQQQALREHSVTSPNNRNTSFLCGTFYFAYENRTVGMICLLSALISLPETVLFDVRTQYIYGVFGLLGGSNEDDSSQRTWISLLSFTCGQLAFTCGSGVVGYLSKKFSAHRVLAWLLPMVAVAQSANVILLLTPYMWAVAMTGILNGSSLIVMVPLQVLVVQESPPERVSEAMGAVGAAKALATLLGNLLVSVCSPLLQASSLANPLWVFFPASSFISLTGLVLLRRVKRDSGFRRGRLGDVEVVGAEAAGFARDRD